MAHVYRPTYTVPVPRGAAIATEGGVRYATWTHRGRRVKAPLAGDGRRCTRESPRYWVEYRDADGVRQRRKAYHDRAASEQFARDLVRQSERAAMGLDAPGRDPRDALPCLRHLIDLYRDHLAAHGRDPVHVASTIAKLRRVTEGLGIAEREPGRAVAGGFARWLAAETALHGWAPRTRNLYASSAAAFGRWLTTDDGGRHLNPFPPVKKLDEESGRTFRRRALADAEIPKLLNAARRGPTYYGLTGEDRYGLYLLAIYTGYRIDEIQHLTAGDVEWSNGRPVAVLLPARYSKRRRAERQPVPVSVRRSLADWLRTQPRTGRFFAHPFRWWSTRGAEMLRIDLAAAGVPFEAGGRRIDFHSLRVTYVTLLARAGVPLQHAQKLARHSTPVLTANVYTQVEDELAAQADRILGPSLGRSPGNSSRENPRTLAGRSSARKTKSLKNKPKSNSGRRDKGGRKPG